MSKAPSINGWALLQLDCLSCLTQAETAGKGVSKGSCPVGDRATSLKHSQYL